MKLSCFGVLCLNTTWFPAGSAVWEGYGPPRRRSLYGGSMSLGAGFEGFIAWPHFLFSLSLPSSAPPLPSPLSPSLPIVPPFLPSPFLRSLPPSSLPPPSLPPSFPLLPDCQAGSMQLLLGFLTMMLCSGTVNQNKPFWLHSDGVFLSQ